MQTSFSLAQLADPDISEADKILRTCVHCGFCTATCPTYLLLGDEDDSPRGRIYLIKEMLENAEPARREVVKHIDRCLSCLGCMTTCPSGVHYMHLVDHARVHVEKTYRRPIADRLVRSALLWVMTDPKLFRRALLLALLVKPIAPLFDLLRLKMVAAMLRLAPWRAPRGGPATPGVVPAAGLRRGRVALLSGCVANVLAPGINQAAIRVLTRHGFDVVLARDEGCCGALAHHMGRKEEAHAAACRNIDAWSREVNAEGIDAIVTTASGCGTTMKDYGFMLRHYPGYAAPAKKIAAISRDISEFINEINCLQYTQRPSLKVAYHPACSLAHGQRVTTAPREMLSKAGFMLIDIPESHLCCGSAGTYNMLQPELANRLRDRKIANIDAVMPELIAAGNIGCITQIAAGTPIPVVHPIELIDWATGGSAPRALERMGWSDAIGDRSE
ncbi:MAG TPA: glycolate oxidase subunit GlcF [Xanthobacteraceae bacterium]|nr:glycolate oxidase subunit GlcF [Xanthobacteraceae bacterium]